MGIRWNPHRTLQDEPLEGISVAKGGEVFYATLEEPERVFHRGLRGSGDIMLTLEGVQFEMEFTDGGGRPGPGFGMDITTSEFDMSSGKEGTNHKMTVEFPMNGRMDITVLGLDSEDITIVARWDVSDSRLTPLSQVMITNLER